MSLWCPPFARALASDRSGHARGLVTRPALFHCVDLSAGGKTRVASAGSGPRGVWVLCGAAASRGRLQLPGSNRVGVGSFVRGDPSRPGGPWPSNPPLPVGSCLRNLGLPAACLRRAGAFVYNFRYQYPRGKTPRNDAGLVRLHIITVKGWSRFDLCVERGKYAVLFQSLPYRKVCPRWWCAGRDRRLASWGCYVGLRLLLYCIGKGLCLG